MLSKDEAINKIKEQGIDGITNQIICADCLDVMKEMPDNSVDLVLTDIPYAAVNRESNGLRDLDKKEADIATFEVDAFIDEGIRITGGSCYIFCGTEQVSLIRKKFVSAGLPTRLCIWEKTNPSPMNGQHLWLSSLECCVYAKKSNATFNQSCKSSVFRFPAGSSKRHPTEKPIRLFQYLIQTSSNENDIVFDPCGGSGTTAEACHKLDRRFIVIEINPDYCKIAEDRLRQQVLF